ncbi:MAG TPA: PPOX class F420-dependent oxidoreductase [Methylomirabilota bacterium]|jgi:PPOX class probable F420-dependent enzyme|nr:PPOX class F420-dependent oxidoreductase [Methylomirabilota bacterium]
MERMTKEECMQFLRSPVRTAKLATVRKDGRPLVVPVWYDLEGETVVFMTAQDSLKARNMRRNPRVSLCVDDEATPFAYVELEGTVVMSDDADQALSWATRIGGRYMGQELAEAYGKINSGPEVLVVRVTPTNMHGYKDITGRYPQPAQSQGPSR